MYPYASPALCFSDMLFEGALKRGTELPLVEALIRAGADLDFQREREDGRKSDTPLIGAASLGSEEVGLRLLEAGARRMPSGRVVRPLLFFGDCSEHRDHLRMRPPSRLRNHSVLDVELRL